MNYTELYTVGGTVLVDNKALYIHRQADEDLLELGRTGKFAYILTSRQVGKSSLMARTAVQLQKEGMHCATISLQNLGTQFELDADWYLSILIELEDELELETDVLEWWEEHAHLSGTQRFSSLLKEIMQNEISESVVIFIDEIDKTLALEFADDFFAVIRALYNARANTPALRRLSFVLIGMAIPSDLISNPKRTPFNIGERIEIMDFTLSQAQPFASGLGLPDNEAEQVLEKIFEWTSGHPYLTQRVCYEFARQSEADKSIASVNHIVEDLFLSEKGIEEHNIRFVHDTLIKPPNPLEVKEVLSIYRNIRQGRHIPDESQSLVKNHLKLSGIIVRGQNRQLEVRNRIYEEVFNEQWVKEQWPLPWWHELLTARVAATLLSIMVAISLCISAFAWVEYKKARFQSNANQALNELSQKNTNEALLFALAAVRTDPVAHPFWPSQALQKLMVCLQTLPTILDGNLQEICSAPVGYSPLASRALRNVIESVETLPSILDEGLREIHSATWSPSGEYILIRDRDGKVQVWNSTSGVLAASLDTSQIGGAQAAVWHPYEMQILIGGEDTVQIWEWESPPMTQTVEFTPTLAYTYPLELENDSISSVAWHPDGEQFLIATSDQRAEIWTWEPNTASAQLQHSLKGISSPVRVVVWSPDGKKIVTGGQDRTAQLWDTEQGELLHSLLGHSDRITSASWHPDSSQLLTSSSDGTAKIWNAETGQLQHALEGHEGTVWLAEWSPNGQKIATAGKDGTARVWDADRGKLLHTLEGHTDQVKTIAWQPTGSWVVTGSRDGTARVWDADWGTLLSTLEGHREFINSVAWSPKGKHIVTAGNDSTARVWVADESLLIAKLTERVCIVWEEDDTEIKALIPDWAGCTNELETVDEELKAYDELRLDR